MFVEDVGKVVFALFARRQTERMTPDIERELVLTAPAGADLRANWTPDGARIVFERLDGAQRRLLSIAADGGDLRELGESVNAPGSHSTGRPAWTISGELLFVSDRSGSEGVWRQAATGKVRPVTPPGSTAYGPAAAPGLSQTLHFRKQGEEMQVWVCSPDGSAARQLTSGPGIHDQPWPTRSGEVFYHVQQGGRHQVRRLSLAGELSGNQVAVLTPVGEDEGGAYVTPFPAPDGQWIAFTRQLQGVRQLWLMRPDGRQRLPLTSGEAHCFPAWHPDGSRLLAVRGDPFATPPSGQLVVLDLSGV